jgi:magnesium transporter
VRWVNVDGLTDMGVIRALAEKYNLHPLAIEDLLNAGQRPKVDRYEAEGEWQARLFISARMVKVGGRGEVRSELVSIFAGHKTVLTFQATRGDAWGDIRRRIAKEGTRVRRGDASFLVYSLLDAMVDQCFPLLEHYGEWLEELEGRVLQEPKREVIREVYRVRRELLQVRRAVWPMREVVHALQVETHECFGEEARVYMRDVYDHLVQIIDVLETYREMGVELAEMYMGVMSNRMNEVIKVLTIIGTIFIPLTFLSGVYGMNMRIPEEQWAWAYPTFWVVCVVVAGGMVVWFRRKGWL